jgi:hypothetical protein
MRRVPYSVLIVVLALAGAVHAAGPSPSLDVKVARRISIAEVQKRLAAKEKVLILDSRAGVAGAVMIAGAVHVPDSQVATWAKDVPRDALIVTYCA